MWPLIRNDLEIRTDFRIQSLWPGIGRLKNKNTENCCAKKANVKTFVLKFSRLFKPESRNHRLLLLIKLWSNWNNEITQKILQLQLWYIVIRILHWIWKKKHFMYYWGSGHQAQTSFLLRVRYHAVWWIFKTIKRIRRVNIRYANAECKYIVCM